MPEGLNLVVDVLADFDSDEGHVSWTFQSLDPDTMQEPEDPYAGFLSHLTENNAHMGSVFYVVRAKDDLETGTVIENFAVVMFDEFSGGPTPTIFNTIDAGLPGSRVEDLSAEVPDETFTVSWSGEDDADGTPGSGIATYTIYVKVDDGDWEVWLEDTTETCAAYPGVSGHRYAFRSVAKDYVGHEEDDPGVGRGEPSLGDACQTDREPRSGDREHHGAHRRELDRPQLEQRRFGGVGQRLSQRPRAQVHQREISDDEGRGRDDDGALYPHRWSMTPHEP